MGENLIKDESLEDLAGVCPAVNNLQTPNSIKLYEMAASCLGKFLVPKGYDPMYGCAIAVNSVYKRAFGIEIGGDASTYNLLQALIKSENFKEVTIPLPGDIIMCATGTQPATSPLKHGHVGIVAKYGILSNNSANGVWSENYTLGTWMERYVTIGQFPVRYFRPL